ncbi:MAG: endolytic transglycosylase MltG [Oscillatoria princeps RMCB-10]|jgi:UPF0755 protein|nr:endolytic transglycosylase MltG [Oscillatoria princeps RMCB-10]
MKVVQRIATWLLLVLVAGLGIGAWQGKLWWEKASAPVSQGPQAQPVRFRIEPGTPALLIGQKLESAGLIRSEMAWRLWARWLLLQNSSTEFKAGTYKLSPAQSLQEIATQILTNKVVTVSFTIPEGWSLKQMAAYFESEGFFPAADFLAASKQIPKDQYPWLPDGLPHLEGFLYPDTYQLIGDDITPTAVIRQMLNQFQVLALPIYQNSPKKSELNLRDWVTLSSIVEKEAVVPAEAPTIAGVFTRRLELGMTLGSDPTVEYGLGVTQTPDKPLTYAQVGTPSPYNTYLNPGLPPTPIASPGLRSLKATLSPEETEYLYFVARYDGTHVFSRTLAEHETAQARIHNERDAKRNSN